MEQLKIRSHASNKIMGTGKKEPLTQTAKSYIKSIAQDEWSGTRKELQCKKIAKGLALEDEAIEAYAEAFNLGMIAKNEKHFKNRYIQGTPDVILRGCIVDIKCSWDHTTFPRFEDEIPNKDYYAQLQSYMWLTGKKKAKLVYVLLTTPDYIWDGEPNYDHIPIKERIKVFEINYNPEFIEKLKTKVLDSRVYYNKLTSKSNTKRLNKPVKAKK